MLLHENGHHVALWGKFPDYTDEVRRRRENFKFLPGVPLPKEIELINGTKLPPADLLFSAIPTQFIRETLYLGRGYVKYEEDIINRVQYLCSYSRLSGQYVSSSLRNDACL